MLQLGKLTANEIAIIYLAEHSEYIREKDYCTLRTDAINIATCIFLGWLGLRAYQDECECRDRDEE